jgi:cytochrome c oxidase assembly protein subunit 15
LKHTIKPYTAPKKSFENLVKAALVSVYMIFLAGSFVRMTGSGMGCPDWPKCFGYYIPPTSEEQLTWKAETGYKKGSMIVRNQALFVALSDLKTGKDWNSENWEVYTKHSYAIFNAFHTWTEYINRLASVVSGLIFLALIYASLKFWKSQKAIPMLSFAAFFLMLFEAWLGKTVVDSVLKPSTITVHMVVGLLIIALLITLLHLLTEKKKKALKFQMTFQNLLWVAALFSVIQIAMGTQVRQFVDEQVKLFGFENKQMSLYNPNLNFYVHRSFTIALILVNFLIYLKNKSWGLGYKTPRWIMGLLGLEALSGILMYYSDFPFGTQAVHLMSGALLFGLQYHLILMYRTDSIPAAQDTIPSKPVSP